MTAKTETKDKVDTSIWDDHRITTSGLCTAIGIGKLVVMALFRKLGYRKVCSRWVPKKLNSKHKTAQKNMCRTSPV
jgi:hypothetical protein